MDSLLFHPKLVHLPIALGLLMPLISGALLLAWWRRWLPSSSWSIVLGLQILLLGSGLLAKQTGETEEDRVEQVVSKSVIHEHEEAAEAFVLGSGVVLLVMAGAFAAAKSKAGLPLAAVSVLGSLVVLGLDYRCGQAGGELVYKHGAAQAYLSDPGPTTVVPSLPGAQDEEQEHD